MNDLPQTYRSAIGKGNIIIIALIAIAIGLIQHFTFTSFWGAIISTLVVILFFTILYFSINYRIVNHQLKVSSLFARRGIDIFQISSLQTVYSYLQQPYSFSEKRIRIVFNYGDYIDISPQKTDVFIAELLVINPMIQHRREPSWQE